MFHPHNDYSTVASIKGNNSFPINFRVAMSGSPHHDVVVTWGEPVAFDEGSDRKSVARQLETTVRRLTNEAMRGPAAVRGAASAPQTPAFLFAGKSGKTDGRIRAAAP